MDKIHFHQERCFVQLRATSDLVSEPENQDSHLHQTPNPEILNLNTINILGQILCGRLPCALLDV